MESIMAVGFLCILSAISSTGLAAPLHCHMRNEVTVPVRGMATLSCHLPTPRNTPDILEALWIKTRHESEDLASDPEDGNRTFEGQNYSYVTAPAEARLRMENVTESDGGEYVCWLYLASTGLQTQRHCCSIRLHVETQDGDGAQLVLTMWLLYLLSLSICVVTLSRWGAKLKDQHQVVLGEAFLV